MKNIIFFLFIMSCSNIKVDPFVVPQKVESKSNRDLWVGKSLENLDLHPYFATFGMESRISSEGTEVRTYKNSGGKASEANCRGLLGCRGTQVEVICSHIFYIKEKKIIEYKRIGSCTEDENPDLAPI